jgi:ABC-type branched-subunit amino acid transport system substrate-binding protein
MTASTGNVPGRIFMSYRREDTAYPAAWLYDLLAGHFGTREVFRDTYSIKVGDDFVEVISDAVGSCDVLLALIGGRWLTITGEDRRRRLENPDDFVRLEIEAALARNVRVIPILVGGARMPRAEELPASLAKLARRQALVLPPDRFHANTARLFEAVDSAIEEARQQTGERARQEMAVADRVPPRGGDPEPDTSGSGVRQTRLFRRGPARTGAVAVLIIAALCLTGFYCYRLVDGRAKNPGDPSAARCTARLGGLKDNERIGFVDSSCFTAGSDMAVVARNIERENVKVVSGPVPYRTVVFFGVMTSSANGSASPASLFQLRGVMAAQHQYNQENPKVKIRVLLANAGDQFQAGLTVAKLIGDQAWQDPSIVAVIGIGQSWTFARDADQELGELDLPVIGTSVTGDQMMDSKNFFSISPSNERQAQLAATFAQRNLGARTVLVLANPNQNLPGGNSDLYSQDLASQFSHFFSDSAHRVIDCSYGTQETPEVSCQGHSLTIPQLRERICQEKPDLIFFAARAETLPQLFTTPGGTCGHLPPVLGSSDVPKYADTTDLSQAILKFGSQLSYISFAPAKLSGCFNPDGTFSGADTLHGTGLRQFQTKPMCDFLHYYRTTWQTSASLGAADNDGGLTYDSSDAMLGYDALQAIIQVLRVTGDPNINGANVLKELNSGKIAFNGASGRISFSAQDHIPPYKPVYVTSLDARKGTLTLRESCGQFSDLSATGEGGGYCPSAR